MKLTISLPDDLAALVRSQPNTSGYIAEAIRFRRDRDLAVAAVGRIQVPAEVRAEIEESVRNLERRRADPAWKAELEARLDAINTRRWPE